MSAHFGTIIVASTFGRSFVAAADADAAQAVLTPDGTFAIGNATIDASGLTGARAYVLPDYPGTIVLDGDLSIFALLDGGNTFTGTQTVSWSNNGAAVGPTIVTYRNSSSPAANDLIGEYRFDGKDSAANDQTYASIYGVILDPTSTSEDGAVVIATYQAGSQVAAVTIGQGVQIGAPTGGDKGVGTLNCTAIYVGNVAIVVTTDSRLSDTRTPTDNTVSTAKIIDANVTLAKINGGAPLGLFASSAVSVTGATTATLNRLHVVTGTSADYTITLPAVSGNSGAWLAFQFGSATDLSKVVTLDGNSSEVIRSSFGSSALTRKYVHDEFVLLRCNGTDWQVVSETTLEIFFSAKRGTTQSISASTVTKIQFGTENWDVGGCYDNATNYRFTPTAPGIYRLSLVAGIDAVADGKIIYIAVRFNNTVNHWLNVVGNGAASSTGLIAGSCELEFNGSSDYAEAIIYHTDTTARNTVADQSGGNETYMLFEGRRINRGSS